MFKGDFEDICCIYCNIHGKLLHPSALENCFPEADPQARSPVQVAYSGGAP